MGTLNTLYRHEQQLQNHPEKGGWILLRWLELLIFVTHKYERSSSIGAKSAGPCLLEKVKTTSS